MAKYIIYKDGAYNFYTTIMDAACYESALTLEQVREIIREQYGTNGIVELPHRLDRAHKFGCSAGMSLEDCIVCNRAGPDETEITLEDFIAKYLTLRDASSAEGAK